MPCFAKILNRTFLVRLNAGVWIKQAMRSNYLKYVHIINSSPPIMMTGIERGGGGSCRTYRKHKNSNTPDGNGGWEAVSVPYYYFHKSVLWWDHPDSHNNVTILHNAM